MPSYTKHQTEHHKKQTNIPPIITGVLQITKNNLGFVISPSSPQNDIMIAPNYLLNALNGDTVEVKLIHAKKKKRLEGKITKVIERKQTSFMGTIYLQEKKYIFIPFISMPIWHIKTDLLAGAKNKDVVIAQLQKWDHLHTPQGKVLSIVPHAEHKEITLQSILLEKQFTPVFPADVLKEINALPYAHTQKEINTRKDFRDILTFTIDPVDAKDFDDAISFVALSPHLYEIGVHIADVSHFVLPHSLLDKEAYLRATSVYLPDRVIPMLPEKISNELCSLRPHEDKLTFSVVFTIDNQSNIKNIWMGKTIIHSKHRYNYEEIQSIIIHKKGIYSKEVLRLHQLSQQLRMLRFQQGAIHFSSKETKFQLDEKLHPIDIIKKENTESHQLIEEWMLLTNITVAKHIAQQRQKIPFPYRIHDCPDKDKLSLFVVFAKRYGHTFNMHAPETIAKSFNNMLDIIKGKPEQSVLERLGIRTMAKAIYSTNNIGHYGLACEYYGHFTSPIRRYPDIIAHRILFSILEKKTYHLPKAEEVCRHCSEREKKAMECERNANKYFQVIFIKPFVGKTFDAIISGITPFGIFAETIEYSCEGLIALGTLSSYDQFIYQESTYSLKGRHTGLSFTIGQQIKILVVQANIDKIQIDFEWVPTKQTTHKKQTTPFSYK